MSYSGSTRIKAHTSVAEAEAAIRAIQVSGQDEHAEKRDAQVSSLKEAAVKALHHGMGEALERHNLQVSINGHISPDGMPSFTTGYYGFSQWYEDVSGG